MKPCEVTLSQMLEARERRAALQQGTLAEYGGPLLCFTMNLAGPVKRSPLADFAFLAGERMIAAQGFSARQHIRLCRPTGREAIYALDIPAAELKEAAMSMEDALPVGRLFDMDVIGTDGIKLSRKEQRPCLVCGGPAALCARSRAHGLSAVQAAARALLADFAADTLSAAAHWALLDEACLTPKPGLVDGANAGAHQDMDLAAFEKSAASLLPYFREAVRLGLENAAYAPAMAALRQAGLAAEQAMLAATGGVNTHKGLIYSLGLLLCGLGQSLARPGKGGNYILHAKRLAGVGLDEALQNAKRAPQSHGERIYSQTGLLGARGEAAAGFPSAIKTHEALCAARKALPEKEARIAALLSSMAELADTNLLHRGGEAGLKFVQGEARRILAMPPDAQTLLHAVRELDAACISRGLSPGGSADMLALALFLDRVEGWMP